MPTVLITGANRGLGLEFASQYADAGWHVHACCRNPAGASALRAIADSHPEVVIHSLDVLDPAAMDGLAENLHHEPLDLLVNNAGVYGDTRFHEWPRLDYAAWVETMRINCMAPVRMSATFLPHLLRGQMRKIVALSSKMGSMADNTSGGAYLYRSSKAALNAAMKSLAIDLAPQKFTVLLLHPGWALTDMGGPDALVSAEESVQGMRAVIAGATPADSGRFIAYDGAEIGW